MTVARLLYRIQLVAALLLLAGCAGLTPPVTPQSEAVPQPIRTYSESIDIEGRLSVLYQQHGRDEALHGSFQWSQTPQQTTVTLLSPFGQTLATINITPESSTLYRSGQPPRSARDVDRLVADTLGWPLPIAGLRDWLQGFATDLQQRPFVAISLAPSSVKTADGWQLHYASWQAGDTATMPAHPKRIDLSRTTAEAGDVSIRIVIDHWQVRPPS